MATPEEVIAEAIRRKLRLMCLSPEKQRMCLADHVDTFMLKVCGCEQFLLDKYPISQFKVWIIFGVTMISYLFISIYSTSGTVCLAVLSLNSCYYPKKQFSPVFQKTNSPFQHIS
jgi:hypothetical protein